MIDKLASHVSFLEREGFQTTVDGDGDVTFAHGGHQIVFFTDSEDDTYFRLSYIALWDPEGTPRALPIANRVNQLMKVAKVTLIDDALIISVECFLSMPSDFKGIFDRALDCITTAIDEFRREFHA